MPSMGIMGLEEGEKDVYRNAALVTCRVAPLIGYCLMNVGADPSRNMGSHARGESISVCFN